MSFSHIAIFKRILSLPIPPKTSSITDCVHVKLLKELAESLAVSDMRVFLWSTSGGTILANHVLGDSAKWKEIDIYKVRANLVRYKKFFFAKIRHNNDDGNYITIGYIGIYSHRFIDEQTIEALDIFSILYGNYIRRRVIRDKIEQKELYMPQLYELLVINSKPGDIITKTLDIFYKLTSAYKGFYFVVNKSALCGEYLLIRGKVSAILSRSAPMECPKFIDALCAKEDGVVLQSSDIPHIITRFLHRGDVVDYNAFNYQVYPVYVQGNFVGLWLFLFKKDQLSDYINIGAILRHINPLINHNYKFIYQRRTKQMIVNPIFQSRETRIIDNNIFVIMPFTQEWSDQIWNLVIKQAIITEGLNPIRADDLYGRDIMEDVWQGILRSKVVIADTTGRNPNVFYELGIAHTLGKEVILLTQNIDDIPFDLNRYRHILYTNNIQGGEKLKKDIIKALKDLLGK